MKKSAIIGLITIAICVCFLVSLNADTSNYSTFTEAAKDSREFHVMGHWAKEKGTYYDALKDANHFSFYMKDEKGDVKKVIYSGTKPQDFERSEKLVLIGKMNSDTFYASKILMKCPSKYNNDLVEIKQDGQVKRYK
ncbi:cytochrome C biogenesis protein [Pedobacter lusitanus]|uniref:Cytochrome c-type biogenesis protein CcmE n=2 Tax=Pedobacter TaxID=84567 RepID=A0A7W9E194_9SPHI|nr:MULTISPECIES: cytochrome c maturation protein CcmE [Pedobacter]KIO74939.1 cytochrome C biogenesis protein [Pedobacter lusitanus]MBB5639277.1 cytochrome c-type biogenesis protein CcmE [Pedobacter cryoconitis]MBB6269656.1 cytochrome c-type biogenesis protein CcmE [Pedobacter cryoconitis]